MGFLAVGIERDGLDTLQEAFRLVNREKPTRFQEVCRLHLSMIPWLG
jgi:hypothetical protein